MASPARRLVDAAMAAPYYVAGTNRACTVLMEMDPNRIFVKGGAEGVYAGALPELGLGIAIKCDDGSARASEAIIATVLARIYRNEDELESKLARFADREMRNWNGITYGVISPTEALTDADIN
jgi:L-asparaginase II